MFFHLLQDIPLAKSSINAMALDCCCESAELYLQFQEAKVKRLHDKQASYESFAEVRLQGKENREEKLLIFSCSFCQNGRLEMFYLGPWQQKIRFFGFRLLSKVVVRQLICQFECKNSWVLPLGFCLQNQTLFWLFIWETPQVWVDVNKLFYHLIRFPLLPPLVHNSCPQASILLWYIRQ